MLNYKDGDDFYFMSLGDGLMLDAKPMGSIARFANHNCDPNCELQKWNVLGILILKAILRDVFLTICLQ
jgi:SET domain-containing protein